MRPLRSRRDPWAGVPDTPARTEAQIKAEALRQVADRLDRKARDAWLPELEPFVVSLRAEADTLDPP